MIPLGYMAKMIAARPHWLRSSAVEDIYSVSNCISDVFADYIADGTHNGFWFFNSPDDIISLAKAKLIDMSEMQLFYYEVFEEEFDRTTMAWSSFEPEPSLAMNVQAPHNPQLAGYDVVTFWTRTTPECSPLSCNGFADQIIVNRHCLFDNFKDARQAVVAGKFDNSEPGPLRIVAVYSVDQFPFRPSAASTS